MSIVKYFNFDQLHTNYRNEIIGGLTTFVTMAYIVIVNPKILEAAGIPFGPSMVATVLTSFFGTLLWVSMPDVHSQLLHIWVKMHL